MITRANEQPLLILTRTKPAPLLITSILEEIDGKSIDNSWGKTRQDNYGQGFSFSPSIVTRDVLPKKQKFKIKGLVFFPTDAQLLFGNDLVVTGIVEFVPLANTKYTVTGSLSKSVSKVWIEDSNGVAVTDILNNK